jgi:XTP/dITP diphosphohydrolase
MELIFATGNKHKCEEARTILGPSVSIIMPSALGFSGEIPETGTTLKENALQKAAFIWDKFRIPCFADDTGLEVDALNGAPGVYSARYAGEPCSPLENVRKLLHRLQNTSARTARFRCVIALITDGQPEFFEGVVEGKIIREPKGAGGFGYDPVFVPDGYDKTFAELTATEKNLISHRKRALEKMALLFK